MNKFCNSDKHSCGFRQFVVEICTNRCTINSPRLLANKTAECLSKDRLQTTLLGLHILY